MKRNLNPLSFRKFITERERGAVVLDCRNKLSYTQSQIPGSIYISLTDTPFAVWVGTLLKPNDRLILVTEPEKEEEAILRLARIGYENIVGYLEGGMQTLEQNNYI